MVHQHSVEFDEAFIDHQEDFLNACWPDTDWTVEPEVVQASEDLFMAFCAGGEL